MQLKNTCMSLKSTLNTEKSAAAILYPDKVIIETRNKKDEFTWYSTDNLTIMPVSVSDSELGNVILNHLQQSKEESISLEEIKKLRERYRKKAKFKTESSTMEGAKYVSIYLTGNKIRFEPKKNKISKKTFYNIPEAIIELNISLDSDVIGRHAKESWDKCFFVE